MARRRPGDKPLSEPMMVSLPTYASLGPNELTLASVILDSFQEAYIHMHFVSALTNLNNVDTGVVDVFSRKWRTRLS